MSEPDFERVKEILNEARHLKGAARRLHLEQECGDDLELRANVESLLEYGDTDGGLLGKDAGGAVADKLGRIVDAVASGVGGAPTGHGTQGLPEAIGPFRILRRLATGGMGTVYEAQQSSPSRRVALKTLRRELISPALLRRFRQEGEILGRLSHPNIAQVYEAGSAGTPDGPLPYFAMEYVDGRPLVTYADEEHLEQTARLALLARICDAVQHAHEHGVIHRDLKPDNILVTADGRPKVLDFGVARATDGDVQVTTMVTEAGQIMGTLPYMSPEQVSGDPAAVDARSDIYALGVLLFELLSGSRPHELSRRSMPEAARIIREEDATRLGSLSTRFRGDVETIAGKALEREVDRRYATAAEMAADIRRHLANQPIAARAPTSYYQLRKFARRHRGLVAGAALAFVALAVGLAFALNFALDEARQRDAAERATYRATLSAATAALDSGQRADVDRLLEEAPSALRGWEWQHLKTRVTDHLWEVEVLDTRVDRLGRLGIGSPYYGSPVLFSSDSARVVAPLGVQLLGVFDAASGERLFEIDLRETLVAECLLAVTGGVAAATHDGRLVVYDDSTGEVLSEQRLPEGALPKVAAWDAHSGRLAVSCRIGDPKGDPDGEQGAALLVGPPGALVSVMSTAQPWEDLAWSHDGSRLITDTGDTHWTTFDSTSWETLDVASAAAPRKPSDYAMAAAGGTVVVGTALRDVHLLDEGDLNGAPRLVFSNHAQNRVNSVALSADARVIASATRDGSLRCWDGRSGVELSASRIEGNPRVAVSPDGRLVAVNSGGRLSVRTLGARSLLELPGPEGDSDTGFVYSVAWTADGRTLVARSLGLVYRAYDALDGRSLVTLPHSGPAGMWERLSQVWGLSAGSDRIVARRTLGEDQHALFAFDLTSGGGFQRVWEDGGEDEQLPWVERFARAADTSRSNPAAEVSSQDVRFARGGLSQAAFQTDPSGARWLDRSVAMLGGPASGAQIPLVESGYLQSRPETENLNADASFSPDGARLVVARPDIALRVHDTSTGATLGELLGHQGHVYCVAFSPDGTRIASGGNDRTVQIWDATTYERLAVLNGHRAYVMDLAWSPDGRSLASASGDGTLRIWSTLSVSERAARVRADEQLRAAQRARVAALFERLDDPHVVAAEIRSAADLDDDQRHAALRVVREFSNAWWVERGMELGQ